MSPIRHPTRSLPTCQLLQHLAPGLGQLEGQEAAGRQGPRGEQDGHGLGDAHEGGEDADAQHGGQLTKGIEEAKRRASRREGRGNIVIHSWCKHID